MTEPPKKRGRPSLAKEDRKPKRDLRISNPTWDAAKALLHPGEKMPAFVEAGMKREITARRRKLRAARAATTTEEN